MGGGGKSCAHFADGAYEALEFTAFPLRKRKGGTVREPHPASPVVASWAPPAPPQCHSHVSHSSGCHAASSLRRSCGDVQAQPLKDVHFQCPRVQLELFVTINSKVLHLGFSLHRHPHDQSSDLLRKEECF